MTEQELLQHSLNWDRAIVSNDVDRISSFMTDDWICVASNGITEFKEFIKQIKHGQLMHTEMSTTESYACIFRETGIVIGKGYSKGIFRGNQFSFHEWSVSVFVLKDQSWKCLITMLADVSTKVS
ncbi:MAG: nuclear transport factor 2 family protein [Chryseolinea sp.]